MTILDSFFFVLKADSKDAVRGINDTGEAFDDLKRDGSDAAKKVAHEFKDMARNLVDAGNLSERAISSLGGKLGGLAATAAAAVGGLASAQAVMDRIQEMTASATNAESLKIPVDQYDTFQKVLKSVGYEADETRDLFIDLAEAIGEGADDAKSQRAQTFKDLGINLKDAAGNTINATQGFQALSKAIDSLSPEKAIFKIRELGINDPKVLALLTKGNAELERRIALVQRNGVMTAEQAKATKELQEAQQQISLQLSSIGDAIARGLLPYVTGLFKAISAIMDYVEKHRVAFITFFGVPAVVIGASLIPAVLRATFALGRMAVATVAATWPWLLMAAGVALVALAVEDLWLYFTDPKANTVTGELVKKFPQLAKFIEDSRNEITWLINRFADLKERGVEAFKELVAWINSMNPALDEFVKKAKALFEGLANWLQGWGLKIGDFLRDTFADAINALIDTLPEKLRTTLGIEHVQSGAERRTAATAQQAAEDAANLTLPNATQSPAAATGVIGRAAASGINSAAANPSIGARTTVNSGGNVNIEHLEVKTASTDPEAVTSAITGGIQDHWKSAVSQLDDGINH